MQLVLKLPIQINNSNLNNTNTPLHAPAHTCTHLRTHPFSQIPPKLIQIPPKLTEILGILTHSAPTILHIPIVSLRYDAFRTSPSKSPGLYIRYDCLHLLLMSFYISINISSIVKIACCLSQFIIVILIIRMQPAYCLYGCTVRSTIRCGCVRCRCRCQAQRCRRAVGACLMLVWPYPECGGDWSHGCSINEPHWGKVEY